MFPINNIEDIPECPIRLDRILDPVRIVPCNHILSALALRGWTETQQLQDRVSLCPLCRTAIEGIASEQDLQEKIHEFVDQHQELFGQNTARALLLNHCQEVESEIRTMYTSAEERIRDLMASSLSHFEPSEISVWRSSFFVALSFYFLITGVEAILTYLSNSRVVDA